MAATVLLAKIRKQNSHRWMDEGGREGGREG